MTDLEAFRSTLQEADETFEEYLVKIRTHWRDATRRAVQLHGFML